MIEERTTLQRPSSWGAPGEPLGPYEEVSLHGHTVGFQAAGEGPLLVLLHGITSTSDSWRKVMPTLAERYTVIAPDMVGHGRSAKPRGDYSLGAYAAGVRDLLAVLGFERGTVVGHSLGGGIAMQFSYLFPEYVERMALISTGGLRQGGPPPAPRRHPAGLGVGAAGAGERVLGAGRRGGALGGGQAGGRGGPRRGRVRPRLRLARPPGRPRRFPRDDAQRDRPRRPEGLGARPALPRRPDALHADLGR